LLHYSATPSSVSTVVPVHGAAPVNDSSSPAEASSAPGDGSNSQKDVSLVLDPSAANAGSHAVGAQRGTHTPGVERSPTIETSAARGVNIHTAQRSPAGARVRLGVIGAGSFARGVLLPALKKLDVDFRGVATASSPSAQQTATRFGFAYAASDWRHIVND